MKEKKGSCFKFYTVFVNDINNHEYVYVYDIEANFNCLLFGKGAEVYLEEKHSDLLQAGTLILTQEEL